MDIKARIKRTLILCLIGLGVGAGIGLYQMNFPEETRVAATKVAGVKIGGPFSLVNQDGVSVTEKTFGGQYKLLYFGFTYCPAICPTELGKITRVLKTLEGENPKLVENVQPIFVTVDPERDTPEVLKDYITSFHPRMVGLTGAVEQIEDAKRKYRIYAAKVQEEGMSDYTMDHSSFIYFIGPDESVLGIYRMDDKAEMMVEEIKPHLSAVQ